MTLSLTSLEQQVLDVLKYAEERSRSIHKYKDIDPWDTRHIVFCGRELYQDDTWGGAIANAIEYKKLGTYPTISNCLGRLRKKGLVERTEGEYSKMYGQSFGKWKLSLLGRDVVGLPLSTEPAPPPDGDDIIDALIARLQKKGSLTKPGSFQL